MTETPESFPSQTPNYTPDGLRLLEEFQVFLIAYDRCRTIEERLHTIMVFINSRLTTLVTPLDTTNLENSFISTLTELESQIERLSLEPGPKLFLRNQINILTEYFAQEAEVIEFSSVDEIANTVIDKVRQLVESGDKAEIDAGLLQLMSQINFAVTYAVKHKEYSLVDTEQFENTVESSELKAQKMLYILTNSRAILKFIHECLQVRIDNSADMDLESPSVSHLLTLTSIVHSLISRLAQLLQAGPSGLDEQFFNFYPAGPGIITEPIEPGLDIDRLNKTLQQWTQDEFQRNVQPVAPEYSHYIVDHLWKDLTGHLSTQLKNIAILIQYLQSVKAAEQLLLSGRDSKPSHFVLTYSDAVVRLNNQILELLPRITDFMSRYSSVQNPQPRSKSQSTLLYKDNDTGYLHSGDLDSLKYAYSLKVLRGQK